MTSAARIDVSSVRSPYFVLHATDFSDGAERAFHHALRLALALKGELDIVHIDHDGLAGREWTAFPPVRRTLADWGLLKRGAEEADVAGNLGLKVVKTDIAAGAAGPAIVRRLEERPADLLVLGAHSRKGAARLVQPSVSQALVRVVGAPALFVPDAAHGFVDPVTGKARLRQVLVAVDRHPDPARAVREAFMLASVLGQEPVFHLLHVGRPDTAPDAGVRARADIRRDIRQGPVVDTILKVADEIDADLIVMPTAGRDGLVDALRGSTTEQVLARATRPVLAVPSAG